VENDHATARRGVLRSVVIGPGDSVVARVETRFALGPSVVPGAAGINFTLINRH
jgi:hypothetical protein